MFQPTTVIIKRMHKYSCKNARVLLPLIHNHGIQSGAAINARCKLGQSRATPRCTPTVLNKQHAWNYFTQTQTIPP